MEPIRGNPVFARSAEPVSVDVEDGVVMMSLARGKYYSLDGVAGRIWLLLETPGSVNGLCEALQAEFRVEPEVCQAEVREFLAELVHEGLIAPVDETPDPVRTSSAG
jgi:hypothetical protein